jgi:histone deacetylase complex regulatory component SIN3
LLFKYFDAESGLDILYPGRKPETTCRYLCQVQENPAANGSDKDTKDYVKSPESHPKYNEASQFVDQVQGRFVDHPEVYKTFLRILNDFKPKKTRKSDLKAEVNILFAGHPDLIEGFNDFISSKKKKSIPENEHVVLDTQVGSR